MKEDLEVNKTGLNYVFRYRTDSKFAIDEIKNNYIFFPNREQLNDPFDASSKLLNVKCNPENYENYMELFISKISDDLVLRHFKNKMKNTNDFEKLINENLEEFMNHFGIACFSTYLLNFMLWGNYANNYKGLCIQYNTDFDREYFKGLRPVEYFQEFKQMDFDINSDFSEFATSFYMKNQLWREEYEIRLLKAKTGKYSCNKYAIRSVILGLRIESDFKEEVIEMIRNFQPHVKIYDSILMKEGFGLTLTEI